MGREQCIAVIIAVLAVVLGIRMAVREKAEPVVAPFPGPAYAVYFASASETVLEPEIHFGQPSLQTLIELLENGPSMPGLLPVLPNGTKVLGYEQTGSVLHINFSRELISAHPGGTAGELVTVYGIVNTLVNAAGVAQVQIWVEGRPVETIAGHVYTWEPLCPDYTLTGACLI